MSAARVQSRSEFELDWALRCAVAVIRTWHGTGMSKADEEIAWKLYWENAPQMKPIREALARTKSPRADTPDRRETEKAHE